MDATQNIPTVMIVDDTPDNLHILQAMLYREGFRVMAFPHGADALDAARRHTPDLILLDIVMPEIDGYALCRMIKEEKNLAEIPVIFLSALTDADAKVRAFSEGGVDYVTKPFAAEEVLARVNTHLQIRRQTLQLRDAYDQLRTLEHHRDQLVHMTIHDMRSPLTVTYSVLQSIARGDVSQDENPEIVAAGVHATRRVIDLTTLALDVSRMEGGALPLQKQTVDLCELLRTAAEELRQLVGSRTLIVSAPDQPIHASCDDALLRRVIHNLVDNAVRYTDREQGQIELSVDTATPVDEAAPRIRMTVRDNGRGIPEEKRDSIFGKYSQLERGEHTSGLGLAFCKLVVDAHGGRIGVVSSPGTGSAFWWTLPMQT